MRVALSNVAKHFHREVVFTGVDHVFEAGSRTAVLGPNGSGKSTLLQVAAGALVPTAGSVAHALNDSVLDPELVYKQVSIAAPYLNLYEDLSLRETIANHARFKPLRNGIGTNELAAIAYLGDHLDKPVRNFSSGMKQRLKLALAILSDTPLLLLDEPASNLDAQGISWYKELLLANLNDRTLLVASNNEVAETAACTASVEIARWKPR
ncbi:MAG TPA: ABC transporter ATP-binding protein [Flavobacteriales bacterium]|jgi:ABC-type multidrug transport system ATPase subunit|nr:ABC transporter ATP-binding protein [Flavobacteriales bacterium]